MIPIANPQVTVNNEPWVVVPNSVSYTEGKGEQNFRAGSVGGGQVVPVITNNVDTNFSNFKLSIYPDPEYINRARQVKVNGSRNVVSISGTNADGKTLRRTFNQAIITNDYEIPLGADTVIELEFKSQAAV